MRKRTVITEDVEGIEVELDFEPVGDILSKKIGDKIVVAYLAYDSDPGNPMEEMDGEGRLFTKPERYGGGSITDDADWHIHLGLTEDGEPDLDLEVVIERAKEMLYALLRHNPAYQAEVIRIMLEAESSGDEVCEAIFVEWAEQWNWNKPWDWNEADEAFFATLPKFNTFAEAAWQNLYDEGKIGTYLAVPVSWCSNNHGPGTASASPTDIGSADAVWVPGPNEIENMDFTGCETYADRLKVAAKYAEGCLDTYTTWANGEVYGCVVQTHGAETGEQVGQDACWGFYGDDYADEALLNEFFNPTVEGIEREQTLEGVSND